MKRVTKQDLDHLFQRDQGPTKKQARAAREREGLTQKQAGILAGSTEKTASRFWRAVEAGSKNLSSARWKLFLMQVEESKKGETCK